MSFFPGSSNLTIEDGNFTAVARDQYHVEGTLVQTSFTRSSIQYTRVPKGKVYVKRSISITDVRRQNTLPEHQHWRRVDALRLINIASIHGEDRDLEFVYVCYDGQDALEAFRRDFEQFSRVGNVHTTQLFGYNDGQFGLPALIFYDALVPAPHIWERNGFSPLIHIYLSHQLVVVPIANRRLDFGEVWVNPRTGALCVGPYADYSSGRKVVNYTNKQRVGTGNRELPFLFLQIHNDSNAILNLLLRTYGCTATLRAICRASNHVTEWVADEDFVSTLSSLLGRVYSGIRREIIARWPEEMCKQHYRPYCVEGVPEWVEKLSSIRYNGSMRSLAVTPSDIQLLQNQEFCVDYRPCFQTREDMFSYAWLMQAHSVLSERGSQVEWESYSLLHAFSIRFQCRSKQLPTRSSKISIDQVYLFIRAVPHSSSCQSIWNAWLQEPKYFWSLNPNGNEEISEADRCSLGLPSFTTRFQIGHLRWSHSTYTAIRQLHILQGFDPSTRDLARSLDLPLLETVGGETRFEEIKAELVEDFQPMDVDSELAVSLSTLTVDVEGDAMDVD
uniref:Uncharacterized protein n=1 Tax=Moniliophthora roreri TaxID=221103 RepID=A0A0W0F5L4_MONRR